MPEYTSKLNLYKPNRVDSEITVDTSLSANFQKIDDGFDEVTQQLAQSVSKMNEITRSFSSNQKLAPLFTFIDDDGSSKVWTTLKPIFEPRNVPCTLALLTNHMKAGVGVSVEQALELQNIGWEIASHGKSQIQLNDLTEDEVIEQLKESAEELTGWGLKVNNFVYPYGYPNAKTRNLTRRYYKSGVNAQAFDNNGLNVLPIKQYAINRVGLGAYDDDRTFDDYKTLIDEAIQKNAWLIFMLHVGETDAQGLQDLEAVIDYIIAQNQKIVTLDDALETFGNTIFQGDYNGDRANDTYNILTKTGQEFKNNVTPAIKESTSLTNYPFGDTYYRFFAADNSGFPGGNRNGAGLLFTHRDNSNELGFSYQTFKPYNTNEIYHRNYSATTDGWGDWELVSYGIHRRMNKYTSARLPSEYTKGSIEHFYINSQGSDGFPTTAGIVTTYSPETTEKGYIRQEFRAYNSDSLWARHEGTNGQWSQWAEIGKNVKILGINSFLGSQPISDYPQGVSYTAVNNAQASGFGDNTAGMLITYKLYGNGYDRQEFRKYNSNQAWSRYAREDGSWSTWEKISAV